MDAEEWGVRGMVSRLLRRESRSRVPPVSVGVV